MWWRRTSWTSSAGCRGSRSGSPSMRRPGTSRTGRRCRRGPTCATPSSRWPAPDGCRGCGGGAGGGGPGGGGGKEGPGRRRGVLGRGGGGGGGRGGGGGGGRLPNPGGGAVGAGAPA